MLGHGRCRRQQPWPRIINFLCYFWFTKSSLSLRLRGLLKRHADRRVAKKGNAAMGMTYSQKVEALRERVADFMAAYIYPHEAELFAAPALAGDRWQPLARLEEIKAKAQ